MPIVFLLLVVIYQSNLGLNDREMPDLRGHTYQLGRIRILQIFSNHSNALEFEYNSKKTFSV